jgi:hypothetical protein
MITNLLNTLIAQPAYFTGISMFLLVAAFGAHLAFKGEPEWRTARWFLFALLVIIAGSAAGTYASANPFELGFDLGWGLMIGSVAGILPAMCFDIASRKGNGITLGVAAGLGVSHPTFIRKQLEKGKE